MGGLVIWVASSRRECLKESSAGREALEPDEERLNNCASEARRPLRRMFCRERRQPHTNQPIISRAKDTYPPTPPSLAPSPRQSPVGGSMARLGATASIPCKSSVGINSGDPGHTANMDALISYALWTLATVIAVGCGVAILVW